MSKTRRSVAAVAATLVAFVWLPILGGIASAADPILEQDTTINGCNGVLTTPGSENTTKRLDPDYPSDFDPGGIIGYVIDFPVDADDLDGDFEITDCVYVDPPGTGADTAIAKYFVHFVPNNTSFQLRFAVPIPANTPLGSQFCNYAKTTASPSASQASNRKAGPACFTVGGGLRIEKRSGSDTGPLLSGASFSVVCSPTTTSPPTIITGLSNQSVTNPDGTVSASGAAADGSIAINGPSGTPCTVTETAAPAGYLVDATPRDLVIPVGDAQTVNVFVNQQLGSLSVEKTTVGGGGTFSFDVTCDDGETYPSFPMTVAADDTDTHLVSDTVVVGTECTVTETANALFSMTSNPVDGTVTIDADGATVAFTNTRLTGSLVVEKASDVDGSFSFDVDCDGTAYDTTLQITTAGGAGSARIDGIPTTVSCTVTEQSNPLFSHVVTPVDGTVTIAVGDNTVWFTNSRLRGDLVIDKTADVDGTFTFDVDCSDDAYDASNVSITTSGGSGSASVDGIPTGVTCTVTEDANAAYTSTVVPADGTVTIGVGDNTVAFDNVRKRGDLVVEKASDVDGTFTFDVDCTDDAYDASNVSVTTVNGVGSFTISDIPTGVECTVSEDADAAWTSVSVPADGTVTIAVGDNTVGFTNTRVRGALLITKSTDEDGTFTFDVDCTDDAYDASNVSITTSGGSGSHSITGIPTGVTCTVTEDAHPLFDSTVVPADGTVTIDSDGETVAFDNLRKRGSLIVSKAVVDDTASGPYDFAYSVDCGDFAVADFHLGTAQGLSLTHQVDGIPTGTECTVTEAHDASWAMQVTPEDGTVTIAATPVTVAFTNTKLYTDVTMSKSSDPVSGTAVTDGDTITYTMSYANGGNVAADVTITDEVPDGTTYVAGSAGSGTLAGGELSWDVTIPAGGSGSVSFSVTVDAGLTDPFTIRNVALLHEGEEETPTNETEHPVAHVDIRKAVDKAAANYGDELLYTLTVTNPSAAALTDVVVSDAVPAGTTFLSASDGGTCDDPCTTVTWPAVDLEAGASFERTFVVVIDTPAAAPDGAIDGTEILNTGAVDSAETPQEPSNEVRTVVAEVLGVKIVKPPALPTTGATFPVPQTVLLAIALLVSGAGLTFAPGWRARLAKAAEGT
jgi:uncharacterized repeat protein (TIGR01451 family)